MRVDVGVGSGQPFVVLAQMQQVPVHFQQHLFGEFVSEVGLEVALLAVPALLGALVLLLLPHPPRSLRPHPPQRTAHPRLLLHLEGFDVHQPPAALFVLHEVAHQFCKADPPLETHKPHDLFQIGQRFLQMAAVRGLYDGDPLVVEAVLREGDQEAFVFGEGLVVEGCMVGDEEAMGVAVGGEDGSAEEGPLAAALHIFLERYELVSQLLQGQVVQVSRVEQFDVVAEVVVALFVYDSLHGGSEFVGRTEAGDLVHVVLKRDISVGLDSALQIGVYPHQRLLFIVDDQSIRYEQLWSLLGLDEFFPEVRTRLEPFVLVAIMVEDRAGLLLQRQHHCFAFLFHQTIIIENQKAHKLRYTHRAISHSTTNILAQALLFANGQDGSGTMELKRLQD